ncbi:hypothetical protein GZH47_09750 [Paenibacillus rhizovicinus]|uniref:Uncharacterized protein n=1 Tax=Paenibacillus rhizovicinus TaxID=2704463 RepID=A0A6C0NY01_9BACL|nr:DUF5696 domain-containing protein [Paenibacillus rhizovicinus]QHW31110.1 hypothetical protein GZH47_09750 [Paenibacillus rhizovicinus]
MRKKILLLVCASLAIAAVSLTVVRSGAAVTQAAETQAAEKADPAPARAAAATTTATTAAADTADTAVSSAKAALPQDGSVPGMELAAQNDRLSLYVNRKTTEVAVKVRDSGDIWYSNPPGRQEDPLAEAFVKGRLGSQLSMNYYTGDGKVGFIDNYNESIARNQFDIQIADGKVTVDYVIGDVSAELAAPKRFGISRFEKEILPKIADEAVRKKFNEAYRLVKEAGYYELWNNLSKDRVKSMLETLVGIGYTADDFDRDNRDNGVIIPPKVAFKATLQYSLDGDNLLVTMPLSKMTQTKEFPIQKVSLLEFFGAADSKAQGYMLVPDGSGALIDLNNRKTSAAPFATPIYGSDMTFDERSEGPHSAQARMPVFGMKQGDMAMLGIVEQGDAMANVEADVGGRQHSYNQVHASFTAMAMDEISLTAGWFSNSIPVFQSKMNQGDVVIRYAFMSGADATYSGMASRYRQYLIDQAGMKPLADNGHTPFFLELLGSVPKKASFLGIRYRKSEPLTTFDQAQEIVQKLKAVNVDDIKLRYVGWFNGGMLQKAPTSIKPDKAAGGKSGFNALAAYLKEQHVAFYPDVSLLHAYGDKGLFGQNRNASLFLNQKTAERYPYVRATGRQNGNASPYYIVTPAKLPGIVTRFANAYADYGVTGLSAGDLGDLINSDFRKSNMVDRQEAATVIRTQAQTLAKEFPDLLVEGGNAALVPYFKSVVGAPTSSSGYQITDRSVPFYEMALHGYVDYAGDPANMTLGGDLRKYELKLLETGANVYFQWSYSPPSKVKDTEFDHYYATLYSDWLKEAAEMYREVTAVLGDVRTLPITDHRQLAEGVFRTTYGNGKHVTVNYNDAPATVDGTTIPAQGYVTGGERP